jgi:hypothetical protein
MKVIRWGGRRYAAAASGGALAGAQPDSLDLLETGAESVKKPAAARFALSRGAFRRTARATALTVVAMTTSVGLVTTATAVPVAGEGVLPGLDAVPGITDVASGGQTGTQAGDLPVPTGDLLGGAGAQPQGGSSPTAGLPLGGDLMGSQQGGGLLPVGGNYPPPAQPNNTETPGAYTTVPDQNATQFGDWDYQTSGPGITEGSKTTFMADPRAQDFNGSAGGWVGYQEYSPLCTVRGVGCVNWNFHHMKTGGPKGEGDGYLRTNGTSLGVAPCTPQNGKARWVSKLFTFNVKDARSWKIEFDARQTQLLVGDGHSAFGFDIVDEDGRVVTTAFGPQGTFPLNKWQHLEAYFDGSEMAFGKRYRISYWVDVVHAETALNIGNIDIDNIKLIVDCLPGPEVTVPCTIDGNLPGELGNLPPQGPPSLRPPDLCPTTVGLGQALAPVIDEIYCLLDCTPLLKGTLDSLRGVFIVGDLEVNQFIGYLAGSEAIPSIDPRDLLVYLKDGSLGKLAGYAILFVGNALELVKEILSDPVGTVVRVVDGQLDNVRDLLADPGRLLRIPVPWTIDDLKWVLQTILNPPDTTQTALGGMVFRDENKNGKLDAGETGVQGATVELVDETGNSYGTMTTDADGRYTFTNVQPRTEPQSYRLLFTLPDGMTFTEQHVPGSIHENTSNPDPGTGKTDRITVTRGQVDMNWHAGAISGDDGTTPPDPAVVDVCADVPTINGQDAGTSPGPQFTGGESITITLPIRNCGDEPVSMSDVDVTTVIDGQTLEFTCTEDANADGTLAVGETATCTLTTTAKPGTNVVEIDITFTDENGDRVTKKCIAYYQATEAAAPQSATEEIAPTLTEPLG